VRSLYSSFVRFVRTVVDDSQYPWPKSGVTMPKHVSDYDWCQAEYYAMHKHAFIIRSLCNALHKHALVVSFSRSVRSASAWTKSSHLSESKHDFSHDFHTIFHERSQSNESQGMSYTLSTYLDCFWAFVGLINKVKSVVVNLQTKDKGEKRKGNR
jgi:hypothetical protein